MIRTKYKDLTEEQIKYIKEGKGLLSKFIDLVNQTAPNPKLTIEEIKEWEQSKQNAITKAVETSFWFTQMETT